MTNHRQLDPQPLPKGYYDRIAAVRAYGDIDYTVAASILDAGIPPERAREIGLIPPLSEEKPTTKPHDELDVEKTATLRAEFLREGAVLQGYMDAFPDLTVALAVYRTGISVEDAKRIGA